MPTSEIQRESNATFFATTASIMRSQVILRRVQQRMKKTPAEIRENLSGLEIAPVRGADIIVVSVDSPSREFAREFANALCEEYLRFQDEQLASVAESALVALTREITRLSQELKATDEKILAFAKEHDVSIDADVPELQALREEKERFRRLHEILVNKLLQIDMTASFNVRNVSILEPAIVDDEPVHPKRWWKVRFFPSLRKWIRPPNED